MAEEIIVDIIGDGAFKQLDDFAGRLDTIAELVTKINESSKNVGGSSGGGASSAAKDLTTEVGQLASLTDKLKTARAELNTIRDENNKLILQQLEITKQQVKQEKDDISGKTELIGKERELKDAKAAKNKTDQDAADAEKKRLKDIREERKLTLAETKERKRINDELTKRDKQIADQQVADQKKVNQAILDDIKNKKANEAATLSVQKSIDKLTKQRQQEEAQMRKNNSSYEQLKLEYQQAAREAQELGTQLFNLKRSGTAGADAIIKLGTESKAAQQKALGLAKGLFEIEQATGNSKRNVGNYNALMFETNQIMRELPNFALSARTGMMALSNNLPMFAEQFSLASKKIDDATGKAVGFKGALKTMGTALFGWQGLLILGITLLLQYGKQIDEFINQTTAAEKALDDYNKALKETTEAHAEEIGNLYRIKGALESTTNSRKDQQAAINEFIRLHPGVIEGLTFEEQKTRLLTSAIDDQITALIQRAEYDAAQKAVTEATKGLTDALAKQKEEISTGDIVWQYLKERLTGYSASLQGATLEARVLTARQADVTESTEQLTAAVERSLDPAGADIKTKQKQIDKLKETIKYNKDLIATLPFMTNYYNENISNGLKRIGVLNQEIDAINKLKKAQQIPTVRGTLIAKEAAEADVKRAKDGSKEEKDAQKRLAAVTFADNVQQLKDELAAKYPLQAADLEHQKEYLRRYANLQADFQDAMEKLNTPKGGGRTPRGRKAPSVYDPAADQLAADNRVAEMEKRATNDRLQEQINAQKAIADNETLFLSDRLKANQKMQDLRLEQLKENEGKEILQVQNHLDRIAILEKKDPKKTTDAEKKEIIFKKAYQAELIALQAEYQTKSSSSTQKYYDDENKIISTNLKYQVNLIRKAEDDIAIDFNIARNKELAALNISFSKGLISRREYNKEWQKINNDANKAIYDAQLQMLTNTLNNLKTALLSTTLTKEEISTYKAAIQKTLEEIANLGTPKGNGEDENPILKFLGWKKNTVDEARVKLVKQVGNLINEIAQMQADAHAAAYDRETARLQKEKDDIQDRYDSEKAAIMSTTLSAQEKEKALAQIDADRNAREKLNDIQQKKVARDKAIQAKRDAIFQIEMNASLAIVKAIATNPTYYGLAIAAAIAAITAIQINRVKSQEVPQYAEGTKNHGGGLAIVGDGGKGSEMVNLPSGHSFLTPSTPTLMDLPKGTEVIPNKDLYDRANVNALKEASNTSNLSPENYATILVANFERQMNVLTNRIENAVSNMPHDTLNIQNGELFRMREKQNAKTRYINNIKGKA